MGRCYNWHDLPDNPERVGDEDYNPQPRPEMDEDEAYELGVERQWKEDHTEIGNSKNEEKRK